ncbi:MBL fold metallo-hydrolase [Pontibacterium sp. N1Y112]|uniref:MBL fold metallo-hydrolase n=1 Tax=Pontibacterium sinense TaxID=2781979 RepID=A0A8J7K008_9GAMM|nr:MBL fold metallo-hydrolase [Pontibacterium sinense]MBE9398399.1 MBL fold metallo-hydrolase [Pontibacterium sinense]
MSDVKILHHGAVTGVTGSCHELFFTGSDSVLIDCGMFQGAEASGRELGDSGIDFPIDAVRALFVTHCHIDHVGRIPWLLAAGFDAPIIATEATAKLLPLVIEDALKVGVTRDKQLIHKVLKRLEQLLVAVPYNEWYRPFADQSLRAKFRVAGHILGSAYIEFDVGGQRVVFSGDLGAPYAPLLPAPRSPYRTDILVLESTYGDREHVGRHQRKAQLRKVIDRALQNKGTVLIPAFSIGRTQELLYEIEHLIHRAKSKRWQELDVIVDSPLAAEFTQHYRDLSDLWDKEARRRKNGGRHPLAFENLITIDDHASHMRLVSHLKESGRPAVVIAASGMCAGGRIMNYLKALLSDRRTDVLFVGYQAAGTPGRDIQKYGPRGGYVMLEGERVDICAGVHTISGYSAHADRRDLVNFVKRMRIKPTHVRLVHGDPEAKRGLRQALIGELDHENIVIP